MYDTYRIADLDIGIQSLYEDVHTLCKDYRTDREPCHLIATAQQDIDHERETSAREDVYENLPFRSYADGYLETLAVYRKIAECMLEHDTFLFHGSCIAVDDIGYLFTAKSGTGKSTHTRLWRELLGNRVMMVNDDKPLIRVAQTGAIAFGTPWDGKHHMSSNIAVPLKAICMLERASENQIRKIKPADALPMLLKQVYRPTDVAMMTKTLDLIDRLTGCVQFFRLGCNMDISAAALSYNAMKG